MKDTWNIITETKGQTKVKNYKFQKCLLVDENEIDI